MTNIVGQLFKSLDPWPGFQITSSRTPQAKSYLEPEVCHWSND